MSDFAVVQSSSNLYMIVESTEQGYKILLSNIHGLKTAVDYARFYALSKNVFIYREVCNGEEI